MRSNYRLRLCAAMICTGLVLSGTADATLQAQVDESNQSSTIKTQRKSETRRRARRTRRRATASKSTAVKHDGQVKAAPPSLPTPQVIYVDPSLFPPQRESGIGNGPGTGGGYGPGRGSVYGGGGGRGVGAGGIVDYSQTFTAREVDTKARIIWKPQPEMTEAAKKNNTVGAVVLRVVLTASGEVTNIRVTKGLPDGLSESAVAAARQIKFQPAMMDGRVVSQHLQIEYNFNDY